MIKIFVFQWILDHWWITLKVEAVSFLAHFLYTLHASRTSQWTRSIASTKKLSFIWDPFHLQTYSFLVWKPLRNKYFNFVLFRNWLISIFPYVKLQVKWRKNGTLYAVNCLNLFRIALNSLWRGIDMCHRL